MTLEDFEKSLAREEREKEERSSKRRHEKDGESRRHHHHKSHRRDEDRHRSKRSRNSKNPRDDKLDISRHHHSSAKDVVQDEDPSGGEEEWVEKTTGFAPSTEEVQEVRSGEAQPQLKRDAWMEAPSALDFDFTQKGRQKPPEPTTLRSSKADFALKIHANELNKHHLQNLADGKDIPPELVNAPSQHHVDYTFGDSGSQWRMTKLKAVYRQADESGLSVDKVALDRYGDLKSFDDAREEQIELDRRETYGRDYVGKEKPSGELFQERKMESGVRSRTAGSQNLTDEENPQLSNVIDTVAAPAQTLPLDQTTLNRMKAQMMKAKLRGTSDASKLEADYDHAVASLANSKQHDVVVLGPMESKMLAGERRGEVKDIRNKRGRERGLVEENEDATIEDMVKEEKRTRGQAGGENQRFAERIAKDGKFDNDLDYMDENASKLAKRVHKSEISLKNTAISEFQKMNRILDTCPLCHHEDTNTPPVAPVISLATRAYLTLPTEPEISDGGACIIPIQHRGNLLECDDDEWEEIRNFMKSLIRMYHDQGRDVIFYENAALLQRKRHAGLQVVPLPYDLGETAPAFFKEAILTSDEEWTQHKKLIDTLSKAKQGLGKLAFRRTLVKEMPYFHVWFEIDGGLGHIVEDVNRWPKGDLFAREVLGGMLDVGPEIIKRQGRWERGSDRRVAEFRKRWAKFDWTKVLTDV